MARHLVAAGQLIDEDTELALSHAMAARRLASRIAAVREAVGLAAYAAGEWQTALSEIRTYHRMTGRQNHVAVIADCERALGRPERAIDLFRTAERDKLGREDAIELLIVAAGARTDLGQHDAAVAMLQVRELTSGSDEWAARLRYAYADSLLAAGRPEEARAWFAKAAEVDEDSVTDAAERLLELDGVQLEGDDLDDDEDDELDDVDDIGAADEQGGAEARDAAGDGEFDDEDDDDQGDDQDDEESAGGARPFHADPDDDDTGDGDRYGAEETRAADDQGDKGGKGDSDDDDKDLAAEEELVAVEGGDTPPAGDAPGDRELAEADLVDAGEDTPGDAADGGTGRA
nr:tetratricopeptide repeat protein [Spirilliplanes yamanashiensis]